MSIPTSLAASLRAPAPPAWLAWLTSPEDPAIWTLLGLVLLLCGLGLWSRRSSPGATPCSPRRP